MIRKPRQLCSIAVLVFVIANISRVTAQEDFPMYRASIIELPTSRETGFSYVFGVGAINDHGQFVGTFSDVLGDRAYLWDATGRTELTPLTSANDINNESQIVGRATFIDGTRAAIWRDGEVTDLGVLLGDNTSHGGAINSAGNVTGSSGAFPNSRAFFWDGTALEEIGEFLATDVNDSNEIVGFPLSGPSVLWQNGVITTFNGLTINNSLQYPGVGGMWDGEQFLCYDGSSSCDVNTLGIDINEHGDVVGNDSGNAFIWNRENGQRHLIDLLDPNDPLTNKISNMQCANGINNNGQILLSCATVEGIESPRGYVPLLLTPVLMGDPKVVAVPFPRLFWVSCVVLILSVGWTRKTST